MNENQHIDILIGKAISGNATDGEIKALEEWKKASEANWKVFLKSQKAWDKSEGWISGQTVQRDKSSVEARYCAYLSGNVQKIRRTSLIFKIAAILAFPVALALGWYLFEGPETLNTEGTRMCEITSPKGHISKCILPDGTEVWVNTGSTISYNPASFNQKNRQVQLEGEAYFEVTSNAGKPFKVITPLADVNVTGTAFNVKAYPNNGVFEAVLAEGSVNLEFKSGNRENLDMTTGQRAIYNADFLSLKTMEVDPRMFISWRKGELLFKDATLNDLIKELERIYDIQFQIKPESLGEYRFRGMFSYNNNLIEALEKIKRTSGIDYYIENKEVWLRKK